MTVAAYTECLPGARNLLKNCLSMKRGEKVLILTSPYDIDSSTVVGAGSINWWAKTVCSSETASCNEGVALVMKDVLDIQMALGLAAEEFGGSATPYVLDTRALLGHEFQWRDATKASELLKFLRQWDIIIDLTIFGLDEIPTTRPEEPRPETDVDRKKRNYRKITNFREEILHGSRARGADMHAPSRQSFVDGAMCEDYTSTAIECKAFAERLNKVDSLKINAGGTDLSLNIERKSVSMGTGLIHMQKSRWHFLPSGVVFAVVKEHGTFGKIRLNSSMYGVPTLKGVPSLSIYPMSLEIFPGVWTVEKRRLKEGAPAIIQQLLEDMFKIRECNQIGEVVFGLNSKAILNSPEPWEFYTARGNVSIAFGRNDHIPLGTIHRSNPSAPSVHAHALIKNATVTLENGDVLIKDGRVLS